MTDTATAPITMTGPRWPGLAGGLSAALAIGLTELAAGIFVGVPSALAAVGGFVVDWSPAWLEDFAISVFGTADKGALAVGTVIIAVLVGVFVGRAAVQRFWIAVAAFIAFALIGIVAQLREPIVTVPLTVLATAGAAAIGLLALRALHRVDASTRQLDDPARGRIGDPGRRRFVLLAGGVGAAAIISVAVGRQAIIRRSEQIRSSLGLPRVAKPVPAPGPEHSFVVTGLTPIVVHEPDFYRIDTALVIPIVDPDAWRLRVTGMVERELEFSLGDLREMALHERYVTIACVSNEVGDDLVGNAKWTGVRLTEVLDDAGVLPGASQIVGRSVDNFTAGFPTEVALDGRDPLIAIGMNDEPLPTRHGFPARLIVPGLYGYVSATKWLEEIELTTWDAFDGYWIPRGWAKEGPIKTQSRIDRPTPRERVPVGQFTAAGVAWAPTRGIAGVEVQVDEGPWMEADVTEPLSSDAWVQWKAELDVGPGRHRVRCRATDGTGETQTEVELPPRPDGATGWHTVEFEAA